MSEQVDHAVDLALDAIFETQDASGSLSGTNFSGAFYSAIAVIALSTADALDELDRTAILEDIRASALPDGSYTPSPWGVPGELSATAVVLGAYTCLGLPDSDPHVAAARAYIEANGGLDAVDSFMMPLVVGAGLLDSAKVPAPMLWSQLIPFGQLAMSYVFAQWGAMSGTLQSMIYAGARGQGQAGHDGPLDRLKITLARKHILAFQNQKGNLAGVMLYTSLLVLALAAMGDRGPHFQSAVTAVKAFRTKHQGRWVYQPCTAAIWNTAVAVRAAMRASWSPSDPRIRRAVDWLLSLQTTTPAPREWQHPARGAPRIGAWPFEADDPKNPDCDTTACVLGALGLVLQREDRPELREAVRKGIAWLMPMQNRDHGWPSMCRDLGKKPPGPMFPPPFTPPTTLRGMIKLAIQRPPEVTDPSTAAMTARIIEGLVMAGVSAEDPAIRAAHVFLWDQQYDDHWWGRWEVNLVVGTSFVLRAVAFTGGEVESPRAQAALEWLLLRQNEDGGWGEEPATYVEPDDHGPFPSRPDLTGRVLIALSELGLHDHPAALKAVRYLLDRHRLHGQFQGQAGLYVFVPPNFFYANPWLDQVATTEALAVWRHARHGSRSARVEPPVSAEALQARRQVGDPPADALIAQLFASGEVSEVNRFFGMLTDNSSPLPEGLPPEVVRFLEEEAVLPPDVDTDKLAIAADVFGKYGFQVVTCLFFSSLPFCYSAANGANVLMETGKMVDDVTRRILKTARFIMAVSDPDGLGPEGDGLLYARKVRLIHAAVRHMCETQLEWDAAELGVPINQEDLLGTMLSFSVCVTEGLRALGIPLTEEEQEAWLYTWTTVAHVMGLQPDLLPQDLAQAREEVVMVRMTQFRASPQGRELMKALLEWVEGYIPLEEFKGFPAVMVRHLSGDSIADFLDVPPADWTKVVDAALIHLDTGLAHVLDRHTLLARLSGHFSRALMTELSNITAHGESLALDIPDTLKAKWNLVEPPA